jgi:hypothetical protein
VLPLLKLAAAHSRVPLRRRRRRLASGGGAAGDLTAWPSGLGATAELSRMACSDRPCHHPAGLDCALGWRRHRAYQARPLHPGRRLYLIGSRGHEAGSGSQLSPGRQSSGAAGATVTARPGSGAGYNGDTVRSGHAETRSLILTDPHGADRTGSPTCAACGRRVRGGGAAQNSLFWRRLLGAAFPAA